VFFLCLSGIVVADQISKQVVLQNFSEYQSQPIIPGLFNLVLVFNRGAAFGIMSGLSDSYRHLALMTTTLLALGAVAYFLLHDFYRDRVAQGALGLIVGGAVGNIIDRFRFGAVVDFLDFYLGNSHWPAFNVADSAICVGVAVLLFRRSQSVALPSVSSKL